jgi:hypothetical protein
VGRQRAKAEKQPEGVTNPVAEQKAERAENAIRWAAKQQAGNGDPGTVSVRTEVVAGERKAVASGWSRFGEEIEGCGAPVSVDPGGGKIVTREVNRK